MIPYESSPCSISPTLRGEWFSRERGDNVLTVIDATGISTHGQCLEIRSTHNDNFTIVLQHG